MIRVLIADSQPLAREQIRALLAADAEIEVVGLARDGQEAVQQAHQYRPDVALLSAELAVHDGFQTAEFLNAGDELDTQSILISHLDTPEQLRRAMRAGAREHLVRPLNGETLLAAIHSVYEEQRRRETPTFTQAADPRRVTRVIAVSGAKGGIGKTTIATNLAVMLARETGEPTLLFDLYSQFGDVPMLLNMTPRRTLVDIADMELEEIDGVLLDDFCETHSSGLRVLQTARAPVALDTISVGCLERVIGLLKQRYRYIVLDVPPVLYSNTLHIISHATTTLVIANLFDITTINDTRRLLLTLESKYIAREKIRVVLNRVSRQNQLQIPDIERALGYTISAYIPNAGKTVPQSINQGIPFVMSQPESAIAQSIRQLASSLTERGSSATVEPTRRRGYAFIPFARWRGLEPQQEQVK